MKVYFAGRLEDVDVLLALRATLAELGVESTARWLDSLGADEAEGATRCADDIAASSAFLLYNPPAVHRTGTGGRHVETGIALALEIPVVVLGHRENAFHQLPAVRCVPAETAPVDVVLELEAAVHHDVDV